MKYAIILPDGAADEPVEALGGRTPLQAAHTPHMDEVAHSGHVGFLTTVPPGFTPASDVATLSVLGYDPQQVYTGRAPLEAAALGIEMAPDDVVFRCNLTTVEQDRMVDFSAGHIEQADAEALVTTLNEELGDERLHFHPGVMYRHLMVLKQGRGIDVTCTPPHDIPDQPVAPHLPHGSDAPRILELMDRARTILRDHPVNARRREQGRRVASMAWMWGQGPQPQLESFEARFGIRGACIAAVDLIRGIAGLIGWPVLPVEGATGYLDTNYAGKGARGVEALDEYDLVAVHVEAPDEAGHNGDPEAKVTAIEKIDELVVGPMLDRLLSEPAWRVLIAPDHPTPVGRRTHTSDPPPFCMTGHGVESGGTRSFHEADAAASGIVVNPGHQLMERFVR